MRRYIILAAIFFALLFAAYGVASFVAGSTDADTWGTLGRAAFALVMLLVAGLTLDAALDRNGEPDDGEE